MAGVVSVSVVLTSSGVASAAPFIVPMALSPIGTTANLSREGLRVGATRLPVSISDVVSGSVDVGTGNLNLQIRALGFTFSKNSLNATDSGPMMRSGWRVDAAGAGSLIASGSQVLWATGDGYKIPFTPVSGSTTRTR